MNDNAMDYRVLQAMEYARHVRISETDSPALLEVWAQGRGEIDDTLASVFGTTRRQIAIVGSDVFLFAEGVTPEGRQAILTSALLAQLVARKRSIDLTNSEGWYRAYFDVLSSIGWAVERVGFKDCTESADQVAAALKAVQDTGADSPWVRVFEAESRAADVARFQIAFVDEDDGVPKVRFQSFTLDDGIFRHGTAELTGDLAILEPTRDVVRARLAGRTNRYIGEIGVA